VGEWIRRALAFGLREHVNDALGVTRCLKDVTGEFKLLAEQVVVDEIAIVRDSDLSSAVSHQDGLCVARDAAACGAVAIVPDCAAYARCAQGCERCFIEDFRNKAHARDACEPASIAGCDACALLAAVLLCVEADICHASGVAATPDAEDGALLFG
jgi:hypothetical protein